MVAFFEDQESDYSRGGFFSMTQINQWAFPGVWRSVHAASPKDSGPALPVICTYPDEDNILHIQYSIYSNFFFFFFLMSLGVCCYYSLLGQYREKLPSSSPCIPQHADDVHSATHSACSRELVVKAGREPKARRSEITHPKSGARAWN